MSNCLINRNIIAYGWNGMPARFNNCCEKEIITEFGDHLGLKTKDEVIHAEMNIFSKVAAEGGTTKGASLYLTLSPCWNCAKLIIQSGIKRVIYKEVYRDKEPINFLKKGGIKCSELKD